jgi:hypothetical protein
MDSEKYRPLNYVADIDFDDFENVTMKTFSNELDRRTAEIQREWKNLTDEYSSTGENELPAFEDFEKRFEDQFKNIQADNKSYTRETSTTTHITRNADGSVHKETTTTEKLPDGSMKTTRIVNKTPAEGDSRTETTVKTTPATRASSEDMWRTSRSFENEDNSTSKPDADASNDKKGNNDQRNWAWWFWSRK